MIYYFLLALSIVFTVCKSSLYNTYAKKATPSIFSTFCFNALSYGAAAVILLIVTFFGEISLSVSTVICALCYAVIVISLQTVSIVAMKSGSMSMTAICVMYGMIIPALAGPIFWHEPFGVLQGVGMALRLASLWLLNDTKKTEKTDTPEKKTFSKLWIVLAIVAFVLSGMAGVMEKIHQSTDGKDEKAIFVCLACVFMLVFSIVGGLVTRKSERADKGAKPPILLGVFTGAIQGTYSLINLTLAGALDSMIYYPIANGGAMLLTVLVSFVLFKEKLTLKKIIGTVIGIVGIVCLSLPIF